MESKWTKWAFIALIVFYAVTIAFSFINDGALLRRLSKESGLMENISTFAVLLAGVFAILSLFHVKKTANLGISKLFLVMFAFACLFLFLEEISYGMHFFDISKPDWVHEHNMQGETNLHNFQTGVFQLIAFATLRLFFVIFPVFVATFPNSKKCFDKLSIPVPPMFFALFYLMNDFFYFSLVNPLLDRLLECGINGEEFREFVVEIMILAFSLYLFNKAKHFRIAENG